MPPPRLGAVGLGSTSVTEAKEHHLTFLFLITGVGRSEVPSTVRGLARAAVEQGHRVELFLAGEGVTQADQLAAAGPVTLCDADLRWRGQDPRATEGVRRGSLRDLSLLLRDADRVLVFR
ncbi:MAG: hypothetical protein ACREN4_06200 [Candidatus Dormibacteria bacterium]